MRYLTLIPLLFLALLVLARPIAFTASALGEWCTHSAQLHRFLLNETGGVALELLTGFVTAPGTTQTALTMASGNTLQVRNGPFEKPARLLAAWADNQGAGSLRIRSPRMHDNVQGIRLAVPVGIAQPLIPLGTAQRLYSQDTLTVDLSGSAVAADIETACLLIQYDDLPGVSGRFIDHADILRRGVNVMAVENTLALGTAGGYSGEEAINAEFDQFKANTDYALIGYNVSAECACIRWRGSDTGNLGVGGPGTDDVKAVTSGWFLELSRAYQMPLVPVFNSANKSGILIDGAQDENGADVLVSSIFVELAPAGGIR